MAINRTSSCHHISSQYQYPAKSSQLSCTWSKWRLAVQWMQLVYNGLFRNLRKGLIHQWLIFLSQPHIHNFWSNHESWNFWANHDELNVFITLTMFRKTMRTTKCDDFSRVTDPLVCSSPMSSFPFVQPYYDQGYPSTWINVVSHKTICVCAHSLNLSLKFLNSLFYAKYFRISIP